MGRDAWLADVECTGREREASLLGHGMETAQLLKVYFPLEIHRIAFRVARRNKEII